MAAQLRGGPFDGPTGLPDRERSPRPWDLVTSAPPPMAFTWAETGVADAALRPGAGPRGASEGTCPGHGVPTWDRALRRGVGRAVVLERAGALHQVRLFPRPAGPGAPGAAGDAARALALGPSTARRVGGCRQAQFARPDSSASTGRRHAAPSSRTGPAAALIEEDGRRATQPLAVPSWPSPRRRGARAELRERGCSRDGCDGIRGKNQPSLQRSTLRQRSNERMMTPASLWIEISEPSSVLAAAGVGRRRVTAIFAVPQAEAGAALIDCCKSAGSHSVAP